MSDKFFYLLFRDTPKSAQTDSVAGYFETKDSRKFAYFDPSQELNTYKGKSDVLGSRWSGNMALLAFMYLKKIATMTTLFTKRSFFIPDRIYDEKFKLLYDDGRENFYDNYYEYGDPYSTKLPFDAPALMSTVHQQFSSWNITNHELNHRLAVEFLRKLNLTVSCTSEGRKEIILVKANVTFESVPTELEPSFTDMLCVQVEWSSFQYSNMEDQCSVSIGNNWNKKYIGGGGEGEYLGGVNPLFIAWKTATARKLSMDVAGFPSEVQQFNRELIDTAQNPLITLSYSTIYETIYDAAVCSKEKSPLTCLDNCRRKNHAEILALCDLFSHQSWSEYSACLVNSSVTTQRKFFSCTEQCKPACKGAVFATTQTKFGTNEDTSFTEQNGNRPEITIKIGEFIYPQVGQKYSLTTPEFWAAWGGLLGLLLGLDVKRLIGFIFTPIMLLVDRYSKKRNVSNTINPLHQDTGNNEGDETRTRSASVFSLSNIVGFAEINQNLPPFMKYKLVFEKVFWRIIYAIFGMSTIYMCWEFFQEFQATTLGGTYKLQRSSEITLPKMTVCISLTNNELKKSAYRFSSRIDAMYDMDMWLTHQNFDALFEKKHEFSGADETEEQHIIQLNTTLKNTLNSNSPWPSSLLPIVHRYLALSQAYKTIPNDDSLAVAWYNHMNTSVNWHKCALFECFDQIVQDPDAYICSPTSLKNYEFANIECKRGQNPDSSLLYSLTVEALIQLPFDYSGICHAQDPDIASIMSLSLMGIDRCASNLLNAMPAFYQALSSEKQKLKERRQSKAALLDVCARIIEREGINPEELLTKFGAELLRQTGMIEAARFSKIHGSMAKTSNWTILRPTFVSESAICFLLDEITLRNGEDEAVITVNKSALPNGELSRLRAFACDVASVKYSNVSMSVCDFAAVDLLGRDAAVEAGAPDKDVFMRSPMSASFTSTATMKMTALFEMVAEADGAIRCVDESGRTKCEDVCRHRAIEQQCNCTFGAREEHF